MQYRQVGVIGGRGFGPEHFREALRGLAIDAADLVYAVGDKDVTVYDPQGKL